MRVWTARIVSPSGAETERFSGIGRGDQQRDRPQDQDIPAEWIFDHVSAHSSLKPVLLGVALLVGLGIFRELANAASNWLTWKVRIGIHYDLPAATVDRLHRVP